MTPEDKARHDRAMERWAGAPPGTLLVAAEVAAQGYEDPDGTMVRSRVAARKRWTDHNLRKAISAKWTPEKREQARTAAVELWADPARRQAAADRGKARAASDDPKLKQVMQDAALDYWADPMARAAAKERARLRWKDPTFVAAHKEACRLAVIRRRERQRASTDPSAQTPKATPLRPSPVTINGRVAPPTGSTPSVRRRGL